MQQCNGRTFDQAVKAMNESVKTAMKVQEDTFKFWADTIGKTNPMQQRPCQAQAMAGELIPIAQKNANEQTKLAETNYRRGADLVMKMVSSGENGGGKIDLQKRGTELWEASIAVARENAQDIANTNLRVMQMWTEAIKKGSNGAADAANHGKVVRAATRQPHMAAPPPP